MTRSLFFKFLARAMMPILILFSIFFLLRGHNQPGGGFVGGLVGASSIVLMTLAYGPAEVASRLRIDFRRAMFWGVIVAAIAGLLGLIFQSSFLESIWFKPYIDGIGKLELGTPALFDTGVYIAVFGVTVSIVMAMADESDREAE